MGITGLLPFIKNACRPANIRDFKGCTVAVDAYSWLHKGAFSCAERLVKGEKTDGYVHYCMKQLNLLLDAGLKPILVFDGCNLESKAGTEKKRRENREKTKQRGKELLCQGKIKEARDCFQRCVDVTPEMALEVIKACKAKSVDCIVAPYEADAQLAYLNMINLAQVVITEDSDLVVFGCSKILFKMDSCGGGLLYEKENLPKVFGNNAEKMSFDKFRFMCILSGCDYLPSLPGIGLAKARKFVMVTSNPNLESVLPKLPNYLQMPKLVVTPEYVEEFVKANNTFLYQLVFCPKQKVLVPLNPYPENLDASKLEYAGKYVPNEMAIQIAKGEINVHTMREFHSMSPESQKNRNGERFSSNSSIWNDSDNSPRKAKLENSFKFRQKILKSPQLSGPQKRCRTTFEQGFEEATGLESQDELLFSAYSVGKSPHKKQKNNIADVPALKDKNQENQAVAKPSVPLPFRKTLSSSSVNIVKQPLDIPFRKIVRSRFFSESNADSRPKISKLDSLDEEYSITPQKSELKLPKEDHNINKDLAEKENTILFSANVDFDSHEDINCSNTSISQGYVTSSELQSSVGHRSGEFCSLDNSVGKESRLSSPSAECDMVLELIENENPQVASSDKTASTSPKECLGLSRLSFNSSPINSSIRSSPYFSSQETSIDEPEVVFSSCPEKSTKPRASLTRCRTLGLPKLKRKRLEKQISVQDTLFNFQFTKHKNASATPV